MDVRLDDRSSRAVPRSGVGVQLVEASPVKTTEYRGIVVKTWLGSNGTIWWAVYDELARVHDAHQERTIIRKNATGQEADWSICEALAEHMDRIVAQIEDRHVAQLVEHLLE